jgi:hypothetical protein
VCCVLDGNLRVRSDIIRRENLDTRSNVLVGKSPPAACVCVCGQQRRKVGSVSISINS